MAKLLDYNGLTYLWGKIKALINTKQDTLVSGTNIKTVNGKSLVGSGNVTIQIPPAPPEPLLVYMTESGGTYSLDQEVFDIEAALSNDDSLECYLVWDGNNPAVVRLRCYGYNVEETIGGHSQSCIVWSGLDDIGNRHIVKAYHDSTNDVDVVNYSVASPDGRGITSIVKTATVGLVDTYTITYSDGTTSTYTVTNGRDGQDGADGADGVSLGEVALVQTTGDSEESVMSQKAVTEYGRKVTTEDFDGTSDWIKAKLTEQGWEFGKYVWNSGNLGTNANYCASFFIPVDMSTRKGHSITFGYMFNAFGSACAAFYDANKTYISPLYYTTSVDNARTITIGNGDAWDNVAYMRMTCNPNRLSECYIKDNTTQEYIFQGDAYLMKICSSNNVTLNLFANDLVVQKNGDSYVNVMSQSAIKNVAIPSINHRVQNCEGITTHNGFTKMYCKLSDDQITYLNQQTVISVVVVGRKNYDVETYTEHGFVNECMLRTSNNGAYAAALNTFVNNWQNISQYQIYGSARPKDVTIFVIDRINGIIKWYDGINNLRATKTSDLYKNDVFINPDTGLFYMNSAKKSYVFYDYHVYSGDITKFYHHIDGYDTAQGVISVAPCYHNSFNKRRNITEVTEKYKPYNKVTGVTFTQVDTYWHATCDTVPTGTDVRHIKLIYRDNVSLPYATKFVFEVEVISGAMSVTKDYSGWNYAWQEVFDENGDEVSDYTNIGVGKYSIVVHMVGRPDGTVPAVSVVSAPFDLKFYSMTMTYECCIFHMPFNKVFDENVICDDEIGIDYNFYSDSTLTTKANIGTTNIKLQIPYIGALTMPHYAGEMKIDNGKVYVADNTFTWKQINNS